MRIDGLREGLAFIETLLVLAIILFLGYKLLNLYFKSSPLNKETGKFISEQGINTTNYKTTMDSTREKIQTIQKQHTDQLMDIE